MRIVVHVRNHEREVRQLSCTQVCLELGEGNQVLLLWAVAAHIREIRERIVVLGVRTRI